VEPASGALDSLDESKLHPPAARDEWIARPRLLDKFDQATHHLLALVAAPAGYGKSTLVTQWFRSDRAPETKAFVRLDSGDSDPTRLWTHLAIALERAGCAVSANVQEFIATSAATVLTRVVPLVLSAIRAHPRPVTLVLDDCHLLRSAECWEQLDHFVERLPEHAHLVLITRSDPDLRLGRLRVEGRLREIRAADLSFTTPEVSAVLTVDGIQLSDSSVAELVDRTEGWPAAVYLATLSLRGRHDPDRFVHQLSGSNRFIADYLTEEVLTRLDRRTREFILDMSLFDRFSAALGDYVRQTDTSRRLIRELERTNQFLTPLDAAGVWFRFHHLFGSFARSALEAESPDRLVTLHRRGTEWLRGQGQIDEAVHHAVASGDTAQAATLASANWLSYFDRGRSATILEWLRLLRASPEDGGVAVMATAAWMAALTGREPELNTRLRGLDSLPDDAPLPDGSRSARSAAAMIRGLFGFDGPRRMVTEARQAVDLETRADTVWYVLARTARGHGYFICGDLARSRADLTEAIRSEAPAVMRLQALGLLALCEGELGNRPSSATFAELAMDLVVRHSMQAVPQSTLAFTAMGNAWAEDGRIDEAFTLLEDGLQFRRQVPGLSPWPLLHHLIVMSTVAARRNHPAEAEQFLDEAEQLIRWPDQEEDLAAVRRKIARARTLFERHPASLPSGGDTSLTPREVQVLRRLQGSQSLREIASDLYLSRNTIKTFTSSLYRKLGAHSRAEAVEIARRNSLI
jgi:ATP/maltotriose-dependent transcriptional regulator MalT